VYRQLDNAIFRSDVARSNLSGAAVARSGQLSGLMALESIGMRHSFARNQEIYTDGDPADCWYKVVSGTVRIFKLLADGRRYIADFCFGGDCFGLEGARMRGFSAEAVGDAIVMRMPSKTTEELINQNPALARLLHETMLRDLTSAHNRMLLLGRMTAPERVANFLIEMFDRRDAAKYLDLPMSRNDIADYLGLTIETVCRILSAFKRAGAIGIPNAHRIELRDRDALQTMADA